MRLIVGMGAALALLVLVGNVRAEEEKEKAAQQNVPKAVLDAAKAQYPQAQITNSEVREERGRKVYLLTIQQGQMERQLRIAMQAVVLSDMSMTGTSTVTTTEEPAPRRRGLLRRDRERRFVLVRRSRY